MIICVSLDPALDVTYRLDAPLAGMVAATLDGRRGVDVSRRRAVLGAAAAREPVAGEVGDLADVDSATVVEEL